VSNSAIRTARCVGAEVPGLEASRSHVVAQARAGRVEAAWSAGVEVHPERRKYLGSAAEIWIGLDLASIPGSARGTDSERGQVREPAVYRTGLGSDRQRDPILEVDHIHDLAQGDADDPAQMIALCLNCHAIKTRGRTREQLRDLLRITARQRHDALLLATLGGGDLRADHRCRRNVAKICVTPGTGRRQDEALWCPASAGRLCPLLNSAYLPTPRVPLSFMVCGMVIDHHSEAVIGSAFTPSRIFTNYSDARFTQYSTQISTSWIIPTLHSEVLAEVLKHRQQPAQRSRSRVHMSSIWSR
jgi:HNH endonuclease